MFKYFMTPGIIRVLGIVSTAGASPIIVRGFRNAGKESEGAIGIINGLHVR